MAILLLDSENAAFLMTCFSAQLAEATRTHGSLMLILSHFAASLPITVILNIGTEGKRDAGYTEYRKSQKA